MLPKSANGDQDERTNMSDNVVFTKPTWWSILGDDLQNLYDDLGSVPAALRKDLEPSFCAHGRSTGLTENSSFQALPAQGRDDRIPPDTILTASHLRCPICGTDFSGRYCRGNLARQKRLKHCGSVSLHCLERSCERLFKHRDARLKHVRKCHPQLASIARARPRAIIP